MNFTCVGKISQCPHNHKRDIVITGRSNAGKSTLINAILKNKSAAYTSKRPGKTKTINFFEQPKYNLVDMPGYGYSKNSATKNQAISTLMTEYFKTREELCGVIHICSVLELTEHDLEMIIFFSSLRVNYILILNKSDKLSRHKQNAQKKMAAERTNLSEDQILLVSAKHSDNIGALLYNVNSWLQD